MQNQHTKSVAFLYTNSELSEREMRTITLTSASKKYLGINITKEEKNLHTDKTLMKKTEDTNKWKVCCAHHLEELILLRCCYYPKQSTESVRSLSKFQWNFS